MHAAAVHVLKQGLNRCPSTCQQLDMKPYNFTWPYLNSESMGRTFSNVKSATAVTGIFCEMKTKMAWFPLHSTTTKSRLAFIQSWTSPPSASTVAAHSAPSQEFTIASWSAVVIVMECWAFQRSLRDRLTLVWHQARTAADQHKQREHRSFPIGANFKTQMWKGAVVDWHIREMTKANWGLTADRCTAV